MTRQQAENLARGNPALRARLERGDFPGDPGGAPGAPRETPRTKPRRAPVSAGAPPAKPRARKPAAPSAPRTASRPPRATRDNGAPAGEERRRGGLREFFDGLLGG